MMDDLRRPHVPLMADLVLVLHLAFILFVIGGGFLVWWRPRLIIPHLAAVIWGLAMEFLPFLPCPIDAVGTDAAAARPERRDMQGGFVDHYLVPLIYPEATSSIFY